MIILSYVCSCFILYKISNVNKMVVRAKLCATRFMHYESDLYDVFMFSLTKRLLVLIQSAKRQ